MALIEYLCQILKKKYVEGKKKEVMEKLKIGEILITAERPLSSHGSFWKHLSCIIVDD
jgi:hypothetical protein